jgi:hypothetical protein
MAEEAHPVDAKLYSILTTPSRTRSAALPIQNIPLEKMQLTRNFILDSHRRIPNTQGLKISDANNANNANNAKYYYIHLDPYDIMPNTKKCIDEISPLLVNSSQFEIGSYYTYIIASIIGIPKNSNKRCILSPSQIYATKAINMNEFGTRHQQIFYRLAIRDEALFVELSKTHKNVKYCLYASGEIKCTHADTIVFNFFSGTYKMKRHICSKNRIKCEEASITYMMRQSSPKYNNIHFQYCPFITQDTLPFTIQQLSHLKKHNIPVFSFTTSKQCIHMRNDVNHRKIIQKNDVLSDEELQQIYHKCCE